MIKKKSLYGKLIRYDFPGFETVKDQIRKNKEIVKDPEYQQLTTEVTDMVVGVSIMDEKYLAIIKDKFQVITNLDLN